MTSDEFIDWLHRQDKPKTRAMEQRYYSDPARHIKFESEKKRKPRKDDDMRRVRKEEVQFDTWTKPDPLQVCLGCWSIWMGASDRDLGIQLQKSLAGDGDGYGNGDTSQARRDNEIAEATDAMISSLRHHHRWAIHRKCGLSTVWNFPRLDFAETAIEAEQELMKKLQINVATRTLFG